MAFCNVPSVRTLFRTFMLLLLLEIEVRGKRADRKGFSSSASGAHKRLANLYLNQACPEWRLLIWNDTSVIGNIRCNAILPRKASSAHHCQKWYIVGALHILFRWNTRTLNNHVTRHQFICPQNITNYKDRPHTRITKYITIMVSWYTTQAAICDRRIAHDQTRRLNSDASYLDKAFWWHVIRSGRLCRWDLREVSRVYLQNSIGK
jgi:hypothetical protein